MGLDFKEASLGLASAYFAAGDFSRNVLDHVKTRTNVRMNIHTENVAGVKLPIFTLRGEDEQEESSALLGLSGGGQAINRARDAFIRFLKVLITIASLQTQFVTLDQALKVTNRRVNALEFIQIPKIKNIIDFIDRELDEESREDFYRLKKVTDNKKQKKIEEHAEADKKAKQQQKGGHEESKEVEVMPVESFGDDDSDEDVFV